MVRKKVSFVRRETEDRALKRHERDMDELLLMVRLMYPEWGGLSDDEALIKWLGEAVAGRAGFF